MFDVWKYKKLKVITKPNDEFSYWDCIGIGNSYSRIGHQQKSLKWYERAHEFCPSRNEAFVKIAEIHETNKNYHRMLQATKMLVDINRKNPFPNFQFLIEDTAYSDTSNYPFELHNKALQGINV